MELKFFTNNKGFNFFFTKTLGKKYVSECLHEYFLHGSVYIKKFMEIVLGGDNFSIIILVLQ